MQIVPVKQLNNLTIYRRKRGHERWVPLYVVYSPDGRALEEFRAFINAEKWARKTLDFVQHAA